MATNTQQRGLLQVADGQFSGVTAPPKVTTGDVRLRDSGGSAALGESAAAQKITAAMKKAVEIPQPPESQEGKVE